MTTSKSFVNCRLEGEQETLKILRKVSKELINAKLVEALKAGGELIKEEAMRRAPVGSRPPRRGVRTGRLKRSIQIYTGFNEKKWEKNKRIQVEAWYPENAIKYKNGAKHRAAGAFEYYAFAVEHGTKFRGAQPFLEPAMKAKRRYINKFVREALRKYAQEITQKLGK